MRVVRFATAILLVVASVLVAGIGARTFAAETFKSFKLKTPEGTQQSLSDVLGKATLVIFFSPTCNYCNASAPLIQKLHDEHKDRGLSIVWVNVIPEEERLIADWRDKHGHAMPIFLGSRSTQNEYRLSMTPTYYLIDAKRAVLWRQAGFKAGDEAALEKAVRDALP